MQISKEDIMYINGDFWGEQLPELTGGNSGDEDQSPAVLSQNRFVNFVDPGVSSLQWLAALNGQSCPAHK